MIHTEWYETLPLPKGWVLQEIKEHDIRFERELYVKNIASFYEAANQLHYYAQSVGDMCDFEGSFRVEQIDWMNPDQYGYVAYEPFRHRRW